MNTPGPLTALLRSEIESRGVIPFARFMQLALYAPELGYYERADVLIGRGGDFFTSVSVGSLFGELLAFQFAEWAREGGAGTGSGRMQIVEVGAHDGKLALDILGWMQVQRPGLFEAMEYWLIEPSARRREWQEKTLAGFGGKVRWAGDISQLPRSMSRIHFCNELLDAFPVHRLGWDAQARCWFEWGVDWEADRFVWRRMPGALPLEQDASCGWLLAAGLENVLPNGYTVEVSPAAVQWWRDAASALGHGRLLCLDYGLLEDEVFNPGRIHGTLRAFRRHRHAEDILADPGEQDLTAHVHFSTLKQAGESVGLATERLVSQAQFLTGIAAQAWADPASFGPWTPQRTRQFQTLTHPEHLGRAFRVLIQARGIKAP